ncbi:MAG: maleylpyruvate isomerase family mycothiol-dependent enzyme [Pseudonocardia sp.]|uniref:maleylpyruvate isomerase family mycothiol-dependent enzyme n=1 Tax=unclassified Pseudonocardia TaxID=2619320 RepID=UPI00086B1C33|nr:MULTISPECIES: maleylpyruvate isomerase family mycothiol-dependent enzyme [unclassified Pseudonocardia]MBN9110671.1 maleylpyruvate isomerase family mycothiol-dependent enzyme [Pseudonocardia sp.]ODU23635.1 MAG: hypothetical protein ABS80_14370 [Pseudonocardia sp. SCN 72-51]ODV04382.1 MAG: hypothetical protein ABT15_20595 [Pseudonocardia sp. SCN 73-27]
MTGIDAVGRRPAEIVPVLFEENVLFADLVRDSDPDLPVPTCPEWTMRKLGAHVGRGDRWAAAIVATRATEAVDPRTVADGKAPLPADEFGAWMRGGVAALAEAVENVGADTPVWTFTGPKPAAWWLRRRLHEQTVHRADAAIAVGASFDIAPVLAADGLSEWLDLLTERPGRGGPMLSDGATMHLHSHDADGLGSAGEWVVRPDGDSISWGHGHEKSTVAVRGSAADLLLTILRRLDAEDPRVEVLGDKSVLTSFLGVTPF